jgi:DNA-binding NarL/FixJ family response regulator
MEAALALHVEMETAPEGGRTHLWTTGLPTQAMSVCGNLIQAALGRNDVLSAERHLAEARRRQQALGSGWGMSYLARCQGDLEFASGDQDEALAAYREALEIARDRGERRFVSEPMTGIAGILVARGQPERAVRLLAAAAVLREELGAPQGWGRRVHEHSEAAARAALTGEAFATSWAAGATLSLEEAITDALDAADPAGSVTTASTPPDPAVAAGLTTREREVLHLLAQGLSDRAIGEALFISPRTVHGHVTNLLAKLGLESRTDAAAFAVRHGLA